MGKRILAVVLVFAVIQVCAYADSSDFWARREYGGEFSLDVSESDWYYGFVTTMYNLGLTDGYDGAYMPDKYLTVAEAVTIASRLHSIYYTGDTNASDYYTGGDNWYDKYMAYAEDNGIIDDRFLGMENSPALRKYAAYIFAFVFDMPDINDIAPENIPDIDYEYSYYITSAYNKGIMSGIDEGLTFNPDGTLRRCEAAALAVRCALPKTRTAVRAGSAFPRGLIRVICTGGSDGVLNMSKETAPGVWEEILNTPCKIGWNGAGKTAEGDGKTPYGTFKLGIAFGINENPGTELEYIQLNENHYWVDDPSSAYYNKLVDARYITPDWSSAEHLISVSPAYDYAVDTGYNSECIPGMGSAVFIHCSTGTATSGCIAVSEEAMITILRSAPANTEVVIE